MFGSADNDKPVTGGDMMIRALGEKLDTNGLSKPDVLMLEEFANDPHRYLYAKYLYAKCLYFGIQCKKNKKKAFEYFDICATKGNVSAQLSLYFIYEDEHMYSKADACLDRALKLEPSRKQEIMDFMRTNGRLGQA
jgi:hypothetical protein